MFNLFGSLFFGKAVEQQQPQQQETIATTPMATNEASTQTSNKATTHTQTMESDESSSSPLTATPQQQQQYASFIGPLNYNELHYQYQQMPHTNDWVIVDRSEEADKCTSRIQHQHNTNPTANVLSAEAGINTSTIMQQDNNEQTTTVSHQHEVDSMQETVTVVTNTTNDIILGSFFEKNEQESEEDARRYSTHMRVESSDDEDEQEEADGKVAEEAVTVAPAVVPQKSGNDWQITPLPCLTSTTWSQRSLVAEDPLENLLIEHPSMSVFVTATSSASSSSNSPNKESTYSVNANKRKHVAIVKKQQHKPQVILNEDDTDMLSMLFKCDETNSQATLKVYIDISNRRIILKRTRMG
jgi:succinate dehydrogenase flavin-adding protein (antitoxin of CptAB toxin-antitoxin module)